MLQTDIAPSEGTFCSSFYGKSTASAVFMEPAQQPPPPPQPQLLPQLLPQHLVDANFIKILFLSLSIMWTALKNI